MRKKIVEEQPVEKIKDQAVREIITVKKEGFSYPEMIIIMVIAILFGFLIGNIVRFTTGSSTDVSKELKEFVKTYQDIVDNYYEDVDKEKLIDAGIKGMVNYLDDPYATYLEGDSSITFNQTLEGSYDGIGVEVMYLNEQVVISKVFDNTPAFKASLKVNDIITKIDGESVAGKTLAESVSLIKESKNKTVVLTILREQVEQDVTVTRTTVAMPLTSSKVFEQNGKRVGYLKVDIFSLNIAKQFEEQMRKLEKENIDSLIIDVRNNPGGYLGQATDILSLFMNKKQVIYQLETKGKKEKVYGKKKNAIYQYPVVVLINENSASASEILASAFQETYGASVIGVKSYGKGTVQRTGDLNNGDTIKYTVQKWLTPKGTWINKKGVEPTVEVKIELQENESLTEENDNQLKSAIELLAKK